MRFLDLRLIAYGPFTDRRLDLDGGNHGLHIVYGPKEAGKSASLRGVTSLLYGIPARSPDNFLHPYNDLRVGGTLRLVSGDEQVFIRRKGRMNTLLDANENPLDDNAINRFLSVYDGDLFSHLYGINHETLLNGGLEMKNLKGHIGTTLFSAGLGSGVNDLLQKLAEEEKMLAAPRSAQGIVRQLAIYKDFRKEVSSLSLAGGEWQETANAIRRLQKEIDQLTSAVLAQAQERSGLERKLRNLPRFARRNKLLADITAHGSATPLPENYSSEARQKAVYDLEQALAGRERINDHLALMQKQIDGITLPVALLEHGEQIRRLSRKLDTHLTASADRERLISKRILKENDAKQALHDLAPDLSFAEVEKLRLTRAELEKLRELCVEYKVIHERPQVISREMEQISREISSLENELEKLPVAGNPAPLQKVLQFSVRAANIERELAEAKERQRIAAEEFYRGLGQLGRLEVADMCLSDFLDTTFPSPESIELFDSRFRKLAQDEERLSEKTTEIRDQLERLETEIDSFHRIGHLVSEAELVDLRAARDANWQLVKKNWLENQPLETDPAALAVSYESGVANSDEASDRLRREAAQIQRFARLQAEHETAAKRFNSLEDEKGQLALKRKQLQDEWLGIWHLCRVSPGEPQEMRGWLSRCDRVGAAARNAIEAERQTALINREIAEVGRKISETLAIYGDISGQSGALSDLVTLAEERFAHLAGLQKEHERLTATLIDRKNSLAIKTEQFHKEDTILADWLQVWQQAIRKLPLQAEHASPGQVTAVIDRIDQLFVNISEIQGFTVRIKAIDKNRQDFSREVVELVAAVGVDLVEKQDYEAIDHLERLLDEAVNASKKLAQMRQRCQELADESLRNAEIIEKSNSYLASLCREIGCNNYQELPEIEKRWVAYKQLKDDLERCEDEIISDGGGLTLAESANELEGLTGDQLTAQIEAFADRLLELNRQKDEKARELYALEEKQRQMDGNDRAATAASQATFAGAEVGKSVQRYLRIKLAGALLRQRIEEHRRQSQSPVLALANDYFAQITQGGFRELTTDFVNDQQILIGVRNSGAKVHIEAMSDGTRDQLYLSLRLAYLSHELSEGGKEPMPFLLDDILMNFDDSRALATLRILAQLSRKTQIIYFTHHQHLLELATKAGDKDQVLIHSLAE